VMRTAIQADLNTGAVQYGGHIPEGSLVRFCSPNILETIKHTIEQIQGFRGHSDSAGADAVLLFDCAIRSQSFGSYMRKEIEVINQLWRAPVAGFCSWGEIGRSRGAACGFHNTVISLVLLRDREKINYTANRTYSDEQIEDIVESFPPEISVDELQREIIQLRKQKSRLSHFLHLTSEDLEQERRKSEELLLNILPASIADRLKIGERTIADRFNEVTIVFADLVGFTPLAGSMDADRLVQVLNRLFSSFDELAHKHGVEKIKTIGDAYMAVAGLPEPDARHALRAFRFAVGMLKIIHKFNERYHMDIQLRVGLNSGPVVAGVIGKRKFSYDLWGDAVNIASRMESHGIPGSIHLSDSTFQHLKQLPDLQPRGEIEVKGRGPMQTYLYSLSLDNR
ncbi:MAG: FIST C-terminal domain-containing protein, partial [Leptospiraceae bacterium]|nr:FIST C-terminal domain-containing protein [Leptospiraceae bacterium]